MMYGYGDAEIPFSESVDLLEVSSCHTSTSDQQLRTLQALAIQLRTVD
jgi:hypothetical protein